MENYKEKIKRFLQGFNLKEKSTIIPLLFTVVFGILIFVDKTYLGNYLLNILLGVNVVMLTIFAVIVLALVGVAIMEALFYISAGLSLIIFLSQSYCDALPHTSSGDSSLKFLIMTGFIYLVFQFFKIFYKGVLKYFEDFKKIKKEYFWKTILFVFFIIIALTFLSSLFQVIKPIILDLCVYKN